MRYIFILLSTLLIPSFGFASNYMVLNADSQVTFRITGRVLDDETKQPINDVDVLFIDTGMDYVAAGHDWQKYIGHSDENGNIKIIRPYSWGQKIVYRNRGEARTDLRPIEGTIDILLSSPGKILKKIPVNLDSIEHDEREDLYLIDIGTVFLETDPSRRFAIDAVFHINVLGQVMDQTSQDVLGDVKVMCVNKEDPCQKKIIGVSEDSGTLNLDFRYSRQETVDREYFNSDIVGVMSAIEAKEVCLEFAKAGYKNKTITFKIWDLPYNDDQNKAILDLNKIYLEPAN